MRWTIDPNGTITKFTYDNTTGALASVTYNAAVPNSSERDELVTARAKLVTTFINSYSLLFEEREKGKLFKLMEAQALQTRRERERAPAPHVTFHLNLSAHQTNDA